MKLAILLLLILLLIPSGEATAIPFRGLLSLGDFTQWVDLEYQYSGQETKSNQNFSQSQNFFREQYNTQFAYALLDPLLWRGTLGAGVSLDQDYFSSSNASSRSSAGKSFRYNFTGAVLERSAFPLHFFGQSELNHAQREFTSPYDISLDTYGLNFALRNRILPMRVNYTKTTTQTSGLASDRVQDSTSISLQMSNKLGKISDSEVNVAFLTTDSASKPAGSTAENRTFDISLRNQLRLSQMMTDRTLISRFEIRDEARTDNADRQDVRTLTLDEQVIWPFGRALTSGADYSYISRENLSGKDQYKNSRIWLQHRLFESLTTRLDGNYRKDNLLTGAEQDMAGAIELVYQKKLPRESQLQLSFNQSFQVTDRNQSGVIPQVIDEPHTAVVNPTIPGLAAPIPLLNSNVEPESIVIRNANPAVRLRPYLVNVDYGVQQIGLQTQIVILPGSEINLGDNLLVTYSFLANPKVRFSTTSRGVGFNLSLLNYAYRFYGSRADSHQDLLDGQADLVRLVNQRAYKVGVEATRPQFSYGAEYEDVNSDQDKHQTILGFLRSSRRFGLGTLSLYSSDSYTKTEPNSFTVTGQTNKSVNSLSAGGTFNTRLFRIAETMLTARYFNLSGDALRRDDISLGLNVRWNYGKVSMSILSQINWRMVPGIISRDESLRFHLTRCF